MLINSRYTYCTFFFFYLFHSKICIARRVCAKDIFIYFLIFLVVNTHIHLYLYIETTFCTPFEIWNLFSINFKEIWHLDVEECSIQVNRLTPFVSKISLKNIQNVNRKTILDPLCSIKWNSNGTVTLKQINKLVNI